MQVDGVEGELAHEFQPEHDHAGHPEEEDVVTGFHHRRRVVATQIGRIVGPAQSGKRPQARTEPGIQYIGFLSKLGIAAFAAALGSFPCDIDLAAAIAIPGWDSMPPPQLARDTPVLDVSHPFKVRL